MPGVADHQLQNFHWFLEHYDEIFRQYGECHVAIKDKQIIGVYPSHTEAWNKTCETEEPGTFNIQHCNGNESGYTIYDATMWVSDI